MTELSRPLSKSAVLPPAAVISPSPLASPTPAAPGLLGSFLTRHSCPACRSNQHDTIYERGFLDPPIFDFLESFYAPPSRIEYEHLRGGAFILDECLDCGTVYQREILNDVLMTRLYEQWINPRQSLAGHNDLARFLSYAEEILMLLMYFGGEPHDLSFFDFGMGWGKWCRMAQAFGCGTFGTDISETRLEYARSQGIRTIEWDDIPHHRFDFINTEQVLEHVADPLALLLHLKQALNPEGLLKISVPDGAGIKRKLRRADWSAPKGSPHSLNAVSPLEHINCFHRGSLLRLAERAGLEAVSMPLGVQYAAAMGWKPFRRICRNFIRPLRGAVRGGTYVLLGLK
ncbi:MAG: class I SAM-dependent methyltransferase [Pseudomonadota bacterium]